MSEWVEVYRERLRAENVVYLESLGFSGHGDYVVVVDEETSEVFGLACLDTGEVFAEWLGDRYDFKTGCYWTSREDVTQEEMS